MFSSFEAAPDVCPSDLRGGGGGGGMVFGGYESGAWR
jgi:hypothetical protein